MKALAIGGWHDGQFFDVNPQHGTVVEVADIAPLQILRRDRRAPDTTPAPRPYRYQVYQVRHEEGELTLFLIPPHMTGPELFDRLVERYSKTRTPA